MEIIFLKAKQKLVKEITTKETKPYPLVKNFTSEHYNIEPSQEGFDKFYELLQTHAAAGHALHKGDLKKKLKNESRALMTDRAASTQLLVLDLDVRVSATAFKPYRENNNSMLIRIQFFLDDCFQLNSLLMHEG